MLNAEEAAARLDSLRDPQWRVKAAGRVARLRRKLRKPAGVFLAVPPDRQPAAYQRHREDLITAGRQLDELPDDQRAAIMSAFHPDLGPALTRWWADAQARPYQRAWTRKAFRAPHDPGVSVQARAQDLEQLLKTAGPYASGPVWLAGWAGHLSMAGRPGAAIPLTIGSVLASAIDLGGPCGAETLAALIATGNGEHPIGIMGRHVIAGLLGSSRAEGWEHIERMLLAAQRQEGLRQAVLEAADEGHPAAFDRILATVLDHKLLRFAAAVRSAGVWLGFGADVSEIPLVETRLRQLVAFRADPAARAQALAGSDPWDSYLALCAQGMHDAIATVPEAQTLARHPSPHVRAAAVRYAAATGLAAASPVLTGAVDDPDTGVASLATALLMQRRAELPGAFGALTRLIPRLPAQPRSVAGLGVEHGEVTVCQAVPAGALVDARGPRPVSVLLPWLPSMDVTGRYRVAAEIAKQPALTGELRQVMVELLGDRSQHVRGQAIQALSKTRLPPDEALAIEALLTRSATDIRRGALTLLATLPRAAAAASVARLAASTNEKQRAAATELQQATSGSPGGPASTGPAATASTGPGGSASAGPGPAARSQPLRPRSQRRRGSFGGPAAQQAVAALDELAEQHRNTPVVLTSWQGSREVLFGDIRNFPRPFGTGRTAGAAADGGDGRGMVLAEVFRGWWADRPAALRGDDGLDALRAHVTAQLTGPAFSYTVAVQAEADWWRAGMRDLIGGPAHTLRHPAAVRNMTLWLAASNPSTAMTGECLDALEASLAMVPASVLSAPPPASRFTSAVPYTMMFSDWRGSRLQSHPWHVLLSGLLRTQPDLFTAAQVTRWYRLMRWVEQPHPSAGPHPVDDRLLSLAHQMGAATDGDVIASFLHPRNALFRDLTRHQRGQLASRQPALTVLADQVRDRLVATELQRGDLPAPTSRVALNISSVSGAALVTDLLRRLGSRPLSRGHGRGTGQDSLDVVLSHLVQVSFPAPGDTPAALAGAARAAGLRDTRLIDLAVYAPHWAPLVEQALDWPGLAGSVLWLHAHTKDERWRVDPELRESWAAMTAERTPLAAADLVSGAVDVAWFRACHGQLGAARWAIVHKAAKHASSGNGHRRAQMFAEAMLGQLDEPAVAARITAKRNQDAVRSLGLLPLPSEPADRDETVQRRYALLREFERGSKAFGSMRRESERTAVRIAIENLARTAGYADPGRFIWAAEAREAGDLADGPVTVTHDAVTLTLSVGDDGTPGLTVRKNGRMLRSVPAALRKADDVRELRARQSALTRQATRVRASLETAMVAMDTFTGADFAGLRRHPVLAPMLGQLAWVDGDGQILWRIGGRLTAADGKPATAAGPLRLAHPADLAASGTWVSWQERLFSEERRQPFKQVFREFYALTAAERTDGPASHRYDGHQLQSRQALALFGHRGWVASQEDGVISRVFHGHDLVVRAGFANGFLTPLEADLPTISGVYFTRRGEASAQPLEAIPPVVFSEAMRDLDLVVSVAHAGGVDPEATASTTGMRAAIIRETARLMKLGNISFVGDHILIGGSLGEYSLHLGSGTVHRRPGGAVCIIAVGSQHRGRLFLPFADDDPKTAEIVSKALLLARDQQIRDPTILEQLRA